MCTKSENGCDWVGELRSLDDHLTTCEYTFVCCPNKCVGKKKKKWLENKKEVGILRRDLDHHLNNECPNRQYQCPHCKVTKRYRYITTTHLDRCPKLEVPCPNIGCGVKVSRCDLPDHQSKCQFEKVPCKYAKDGCEEEPLRNDLEQHENDTVLHLPLAIETVCKQHEEI